MDIASRIGEPLRRDLDVVCEIARELASPLWLVGGPVRDALLRREVRDLDFVVEARLDEFARRIAGRLDGSVQTHPEFLTASVTTSHGRVIDLTTARDERYERPGALPVVQPSTIERDLHRRDFTINAIAWQCRSTEILDPFGGTRDLDSGCVRVLHDESFRDDPTRIFRALRLASRLDFELESSTEALLDAAIAGRAIHTVSAQRVWREVMFAFDERTASRALERLNQHRALSSWLGTSPAAPGSFETADRLARLIPLAQDGIDVELLRLAFLLSRFDPVPTPPIDVSGRRSDRLRRLLNDGRSHLEQWSALGDDEARGRFCLARSPEETVFMALLEADERAAARLVETCATVRSQSLPFTGADLGVAPGPHVALALRDARIRAWRSDPGPEDLLAFAREAALRYLRDRNELIE